MTGRGCRYRSDWGPPAESAREREVMTIGGAVVSVEDLEDVALLVDRQGFLGLLGGVHDLVQNEMLFSTIG